MEIKLNHNIEFILNLLKEEGQGYIVGGFVRDIFLGLDPKDCDFVTDIEYDRLKEIFKKFKPKEMGKHFGIILKKFFLWILVEEVQSLFLEIERR